MLEKFTSKFSIVFLVSHFFIFSLPTCNGSPEYRIIGGTRTKSEQFPFAVLVFSNWTSENITTICSGSIIGRKWILTAARCLDPIKEVKVHVFAGVDHVPLITDKVKEEAYEAEAWFQYPAYEPEPERNHHYDMALIQLRQQLDLTEKIQPIELPSYSEEDKWHMQGNIVGFGLTNHQDDLYLSDRYLHYAQVSIHTHYNDLHCRIKFENLRYSSYQHLCTGVIEGGVGACIGDSGAPLIVHRIVGPTLLLGVLSAPFGTCDTVDPSNIFTRVIPYLHWINETLQENDGYYF